METEANEATETYDPPVQAAEDVRSAIDAWINGEGVKQIIPSSAVFENLNDGDEDNDPFIISVRGPDNYAVGHVPGAINIPWKTIADPANLAKIPDDQPIVVYCYTGHTGQANNQYPISHTGHSPGPNSRFGPGDTCLGPRKSSCHQ